MTTKTHCITRSEPDRLCAKCGELCVRGEPDPCLGYLPGVAHACCGHGEPTKVAYVAFTNGVGMYLMGQDSTLAYRDGTEVHLRAGEVLVDRNIYDPPRVVDEEVA
jgi:hypothetical protein